MASTSVAPGAAVDSAAAGANLTAVVPECPVCMVAFNTLDRKPLDLGCGHCFCSRCILSAPRSFKRCPECRTTCSRQPHTSVTLLRMISALGQPGEPSGPAQAATPSAQTPPPQPSGQQQQQQGGLVRRIAAAMGPMAGSSMPSSSAPSPSMLGGALGGRRPPGSGLASSVQQFNTARSQTWDVMVLVLGFLYTIMPLDLVPDFLPLIGWMDDLAVVVFVAWTAYQMIRAQRH